MSTITTDTCTAKQAAMLRVLMYERLGMERDAIDNMLRPERMTKAEASELISAWLTLDKQRHAPKAMWEASEPTSAVVSAGIAAFSTVTPIPPAPALFAPPSTAVVAAPAPAAPASASTPVGTRQWNCFKCGALFPNWATLSTHKETCKSATPTAAPTRVWDCYKCDAKFATYPELKAHKATAHSEVTLRTDKRTQGTTLEKGRYAVQIDGVWKFYRVTERDSRYGSGKFLYMSRQAGDRFVPVQKDEREQVEALVRVDLRRAMSEYGQRLGHCGCCGRALTDPQSRTLGIGPDCRSARGW